MLCNVLEGKKVQFESIIPDLQLDGLACLTKKRFNIKNVSSLVEDIVGSRVALLLELELHSSPSPPILLISTHLTFPHSKFDEITLRMRQIKQITSGIEEVRNLQVSLLLKHIRIRNLKQALVVLCGGN